MLAALDSDEALKKNLKEGVDIPENFDPKPVIAIPTTAGTGSEVTMWATIWDMEEKKKYSLSHPKLYPKIALLDPELTLTLPEKETIYSGLDALSHAMEAIWNKNHNPISDNFALKAISIVHNYLPELRKDLTNLDLRGQLLHASLLAGMAFSNTKTALAHSISYPLTAHFGVPHRLACSFTLPAILKYLRQNIILPEFDTIFSSVENLIGCLGLRDEILKYVNFDEVSGLVAEMYTPNRAGNFVAKVENADILSFLKESL